MTRFAMTAVLSCLALAWQVSADESAKTKAAATPAGELLFGASGGLTLVRPQALPDWDYRPPVVASDVRVGDRPVTLPADGRPLEVPADANRIAVEYAALDYSSPERNRYEHRLEGYDADWVRSDPQRRLAAYANLPPGDYRLLLRGSNREGVFGQADVALPLRVLPAWHQTWWFRTALVTVALLGVFAWVQLRTRVLRARRRELQRLIVGLRVPLAVRKVCHAARPVEERQRHGRKFRQPCVAKAQVQAGDERHAAFDLTGPRCGHSRPRGRHAGISAQRPFHHAGQRESAGLRVKRGRQRGVLPAGPRGRSRDAQRRGRNHARGRRCLDGNRRADRRRGPRGCTGCAARRRPDIHWAHALRRAKSTVHRVCWRWAHLTGGAWGSPCILCPGIRWPQCAPRAQRKRDGQRPASPPPCPSSWLPRRRCLHLSAPC